MIIAIILVICILLATLGLKWRARLNNGDSAFAIFGVACLVAFLGIDSLRNETQAPLWIGGVVSLVLFLRCCYSMKQN